MNFDMSSFKLRAYVNLNSLDVKTLLKLANIYRNDTKLQLVIGKKLYSMGEIDIAIVLFYFLYRRTKDVKFKLLVHACQKLQYLSSKEHGRLQITTEMNTQDDLLQKPDQCVRVLLDDQCQIFLKGRGGIQRCVLNVFELFESNMSDYSPNFVEFVPEDVIIDTRDHKITRNDNYQDQIKVLMSFYYENNAFDLIDYLVAKDNIRICKSIKEFRFLSKSILIKINTTMTDRLIDYLAHYNTEMDTKGMFTIYK